MGVELAGVAKEALTGEASGTIFLAGRCSLLEDCVFGSPHTGTNIMFRILIDTCVWLDLAKDYQQGSGKFPVMWFV